MDEENIHIVNGYYPNQSEAGRSETWTSWAQAHREAKKMITREGFALVEVLDEIGNVVREFDASMKFPDDNPVEILEALIADIEAMTTTRPEWHEASDPSEEEGWFGGFSVGTVDHNDYSGTYIQWPNLAILLEKAKAVLSE